MKKTIRILFPVLLVLANVSYAKAQFTVLFEESNYITREITYAADPDSSQMISNIFIQEIAKSIPRRYDFTKYKISYKQVLRVISVEAGKYEVSIDINEAKCQGDVVYKDFDISDVLFPNRISIKAILFNKYKQTVHEFSINDAPLHWGYNKLAEYQFTDTIKAPVFTFNADSVHIWFTEEATVSFQEKLKLIDEYYLSKAFINRGMEKLAGFNFSNVDMILVYDIMLKEVEKQVEELFSKDFPGKLNLSGHDPIGFIDRFTEFSEHTREIRAKENECLASLDRIYYDRGMKFLEARDIPKAVLYFKRSFNYNPFFVPSHYQYAKILYLHDSVKEAASIMNGVLANMNPDPVMHDSVLAFSLKLYKVFLEQGRDFLALEKFNEALSVFTLAIEYCSNTPGISCTDEVYKGFASSKFGIYKSYLSVSERAIQSGRYSLAEVYIAEARKYQQENSQEIIGDAAADVVSSKLAKALVAKADTLNRRGKYEQALEFCDKAAAICAQKAGIDCGDDLERAFRKAYNGVYDQTLAKSRSEVKDKHLDKAEELLIEARNYQNVHSTYITYTVPADTIERRIRILQYGKFIAEGLVMTEYFSFRSAFSLFEKAHEIEGHYTFKKNPKLDSLLRACARPVIIENLGRADSLANAGAFPLSFELIEKSSRLMENYGFVKDSVLSNALIRSKNLAGQEQCKYAGDSIEIYRETLARYVAQSDFIAAQSVCQQALKFASAFTLCSLDTLPFNEGLIIYDSPARYQMEMLAAEEHLQHTDTTLFFSEYRRTELFYLNQLSSFKGLKHIKLIDRVCQDTSSHFLNAAFNFFSSETLLDEAWLVLLQLKKKGLLPENVSDIQQKIGTQLAARDQKLQADADPKLKVIEYTQGEKWFLVFRKTYLKTYKMLQK